jgi:hypothetical protein
MTPSGIEPATVRFVAQYLNRCATISGAPFHIRDVNNDNAQLCIYKNRKPSLHLHFAEGTKKFTWSYECNFYYAVITDASATRVGIFGVKRTRTQTQTTLKMNT